MTRVAHLSDLHLGLPGRRARLDQALAQAAQLGARHLCLTGDLTESGLERDFLDLSDALEVWDPRAVTVVPGNHDLQAGTPWEEVLASTPLRRFAPTSSRASAALLQDCAIVAVSTQHEGRSIAFRALGRVPDDELERLDRAALTVYPAPLVACMHHPPTGGVLINVFAGLTNRREVIALLECRPNLHLLCGHDHERQDSGPGGRVHVAPALADDPQAIRLYDVRRTELVSVL